MSKENFKPPLFFFPVYFLIREELFNQSLFVKAIVGNRNIFPNDCYFKVLSAVFCGMETGFDKR